MATSDGLEQVIIMGQGAHRISAMGLKKEIEDDQNISLGIIIGAVFIGIAIIVGSVITSPSSPTKSVETMTEKKIEQPK